MLQPDVQQLLDEASSDLKLVCEEYERSGGDEPAFIICWTVKNCIANLLISYLRANSVNTSQMVSIADLIYHCQMHDKQFNEVDIAQISCRNAIVSDFSSVYCLSPGQVICCIETAKKIKEIVCSKLEMNAN